MRFVIDSSNQQQQADFKYIIYYYLLYINISLKKNLFFIIMKFLIHFFKNAYHRLFCFQLMIVY